jgi:hypothetical protein
VERSVTCSAPGGGERLQLLRASHPAADLRPLPPGSGARSEGVPSGWLGPTNLRPRLRRHRSPGWSLRPPAARSEVAKGSSPWPASRTRPPTWGRRLPAPSLRSSPVAEQARTRPPTVAAAGLRRRCASRPAPEPGLSVRRRLVGPNQLRPRLRRDRQPRMETSACSTLGVAESSTRQLRPAPGRRPWPPSACAVAALVALRPCARAGPRPARTGARSRSGRSGPTRCSSSPARRRARSS